MFNTAQDPATRVLQSVDVTLGSGGKIDGLTGTAVLLNEASGNLRSETESYHTDDVVSDLPVRVTTRYQTDDATGVDLNDLTGYDGKVEIEISLENLTVEPENLTYDAVGQSRTSPALVGVPLSIAATATLPGTSPSTIVFDADAERRTNGVVTADEKSGSIVQWGTLLAPPQTEATATLRLVANVTDFEVPEVNVSVQAGLHTDLSFQGALAAAIDSSPTSPIGMQQQAISLVADVNNVLTRAGATITDVRKNLNDTSDTLGVRASQRLNQSTTQLAGEMRTLGTQISSLETGLSGTVNSTSSAMDSELGQIVSTMSTMLGNTRGNPPELFTGDGCAATLDENDPDGTVYSMFLHLSALLDGYADASEGCQEQIVHMLTTAIGPENPTVDFCTAEKSVSATCALFESKTTVATSMEELAIRGAQLAEDYRTATVDEAHQNMTDGLEPDLMELRELIGQLQTDDGNRATWELIQAQIASAKDASASLKLLRGDLEDTSDRLREIDGEQSKIAAQICALDSGDGSVDPTKLSSLSAQITGIDCQGEEVDPSTLPNRTPINDLDTQADTVDAAAAALNEWNTSSAIWQLDRALAELEATVGSQVSTGGWNSISPSVAQQLLDSLSRADASASDVKSKIEQAQLEQAQLGEQITADFLTASEEASSSINEKLDARIEGISAQRDSSAVEISGSYADLITSLRASAAHTQEDGKTLVDAQQASLEARHAQTKQSLDTRTTAALVSIQRSTSASTRDVDAASVQLSDSLNKVLLDLGDPKVQGSGILGAMSASAAKSDTADYQLAEASQHAAGYANVRDQDIAGILLRGAQFRAALDKTESLPPFHLEVPAGATSQTVYSFQLTGDDR